MCEHTLCNRLHLDQLCRRSGFLVGTADRRNDEGRTTNALAYNELVVSAVLDVLHALASRVGHGVGTWRADGVGGRKRADVISDQVMREDPARCRSVALVSK